MNQAATTAGMRLSDWATVASAVIAFLAMGVAVWQGVSARRSARDASNSLKAARDQAISARRSAEVAEKELSRAETIAAAERFSHAAQVIVAIGLNSYDVTIKNGAPVPMLRVVVSTVEGPSIAPLVVSGPGSPDRPIAVLSPGEQVVVHGALTANPGTRDFYPDFPGSAYVPIVEFRDPHQNQWSRTGNEAPVLRSG